MKKNQMSKKKKILIAVIVILCVIILDSGLTFLFKKHPILSYKVPKEDNNYVIHGLFYDIYGCYNFDVLSEEWALKGKNLECGDSEVLIKPSFLNYKEYSGYFFDQPFAKVITSKEELKKITDQVPSFEGRYSNAFFKEKSLIVAYKPLSSGSISASLESVLFSNTIVVNIHADVPEVGTADMSGIILFIEINNNLVQTDTVDIVVNR